MNQHDEDEFERDLARRVGRLLGRLEILVDVLIDFVLSKTQVSHPAAGTLSATFSLSGVSMQAILAATLPTTRQDLSALDPTAIASITYQKVPAGQTAQTVLATNTNAGTGPSASDLAFTDTAANTGDVYTFFVTDTQGNVGALSNSVTDTETAPLSPPSAGVLSATFQ